MTKLSKLIIRYNIETGYDLAYTVEKLAQYLQCSQDQILTSALENEETAQHLIGMMKRLQNS